MFQKHLVNANVSEDVSPHVVVAVVTTPVQHVLDGFFVLGLSLGVSAEKFLDEGIEKFSRAFDQVLEAIDIEKAGRAPQRGGRDRRPQSSDGRPLVPGYNGVNGPGPPWDGKSFTAKAAARS
jgi:hypothetical protein